MALANYATVNGVLHEENRNGTVTTYVPDTLGSVIKRPMSLDPLRPQYLTGPMVR